GHDEHGAGDGAADGGRVEVGDAGGGDVGGAALECGNALGGQLAPAVDQPGEFGAVEQGLARNLLVVGLVGLAEVGGVGERNGALVAHPVERRTRVEPSR